MKAPLGKAIVRFFTQEHPLVLGRNEPSPIEAEVVDDSWKEYTGKRVIVLRMEGENWGSGTGIATVPRDAIVMTREKGRLLPARGYVVVRLGHAIESGFDLPQDTIKDIPNYGEVVLIGDGNWPFRIGDTAFFDVFKSTEIKLNGEVLRLVRADQLIAFSEAA